MTRHCITLISLLTLLGCTARPAGLEGGDASGSSDEGAPGHLDSWEESGDLAQVSEADATLIADAFVRSQASHFPQWDGALVEVPFLFDDSDGDKAFYEFPVMDDAGAVAGSVMVGAREGVGVVASFYAEGTAAGSRLRAEVETAIGATLADGDFELLASGGAVVGLRYYGANPGGSDFLQMDDDSVVYSPDLARIGNVSPGRWPNWQAGVNLDEEREVRQIALSGNDAKVADQFGAGAWVSATDVPGASVAVGAGASDFSNWKQESRGWTSGTCYTGCAPLAMGIILEWNDRKKGYSAMISTTADNSNTSYTDSDSRWTLDQLRIDMGTTCSGTAGSTSLSKIPTGADTYIDSRGYSWTLSNDTTSASTMWSALKTEIDAKRPVVLSYSYGSGHAVPVYEYTDSGTDSTSFVCHKWDASPYWKCDSRTDYTWYGVTKVVR